MTPGETTFAFIIEKKRGFCNRFRRRTLTQKSHTRAKDTVRIAHAEDAAGQNRASGCANEQPQAEMEPDACRPGVPPSAETVFVNVPKPGQKSPLLFYPFPTVHLPAASGIVDHRKMPQRPQPFLLPQVVHCIAAVGPDLA